MLVVQGGPGTGKTAVALHRAAYLLYTYRQQLAKAGVLIIGPERHVPRLHRPGAALARRDRCAALDHRRPYPGVSATVEDCLDAGEIKGSLDMLDVLKQAVRDRQEVPSRPRPAQLRHLPDTLDRKIVTRARGRARSLAAPAQPGHGRSSSRRSSRRSPSSSRTHGRRPVDGGNLLSRHDIADIRDEMRGRPGDHAGDQRAVAGTVARSTCSPICTPIPKRLADAAPNSDRNRTECVCDAPHARLQRRRRAAARRVGRTARRRRHRAERERARRRGGHRSRRPRAPWTS